MEKLIELLNEYGKGYFELDDEGGIVDSNQDTFEVTSYYITMQIISKRFGFIERLVENKKIDWRKKTELYYNISCYDWDGGEYELMGPNFTDAEQLIMILSIQDNPIEYLCSILKE